MIINSSIIKYEFCLISNFFPVVSIIERKAFEKFAINLSEKWCNCELIMVINVANSRKPIKIHYAFQFVRI